MVVDGGEAVVWRCSVSFQNTLLVLCRWSSINVHRVTLAAVDMERTALWTISTFEQQRSCRERLFVAVLSLSFCRTTLLLASSSSHFVRGMLRSNTANTATMSLFSSNPHIILLMTTQPAIGC